EPDTLREEIGRGAADISQLFPELRDRLPGIPDPAPLDPDQARFRLFDALAAFLKNASRDRPIVLVLDDLHAADPPSLLLLHCLPGELRDAKLLVLGTYREAEVGGDHPLLATFEELAREQAGERIMLGPLNEEHTARFIEITTAHAAAAELVRVVHRVVEGN